EKGCLWIKIRIRESIIGGILLGQVSKEKEDKILMYLKKEMDEFIKKNYGVRLSIPVEWSSRMKVKWGYFKVYFERIPVRKNGRIIKHRKLKKEGMKIVLNKNLIEAKSKKHVLGIAKHEALHFALCITGKQFKDGEPYFEKELKRHGLPSTAVGTKTLDVVGKYWVWACKECGKIVLKGGKTRKDYSRGYVSKCCSKGLVEKGWMELKSDQEYVKV